MACNISLAAWTRLTVTFTLHESHEMIKKVQAIKQNIAFFFHSITFFSWMLCFLKFLAMHIFGNPDEICDVFLFKIIIVETFHINIVAFKSFL